MFSSLRQKFYDFYAHFTYRQRFFFWVFLYFIFAPLPTYWILDTQQAFVTRTRLQLEGIQEAKTWFAVFDGVLQHYVEWVHCVATGEHDNSKLAILKRTVQEALDSLKRQTSSSKAGLSFLDGLIGHGRPIRNSQENVLFLEGLWKRISQNADSKDIEMNELLYNECIAQLTHKLHQIAYDYQIVLQTSEEKKNLSQMIYFTLLQDQILMARMSVAVEKMIIEKTFNPQFYASLMLKTNYMQQHFDRTYDSLEGIYKEAKDTRTWDANKYEQSLGQLSQCYQHNFHLVDIVKSNFSPESINKEALSDAYLLFLKSINCIEKIRETASTLLDTWLVQQKRFYLIQQAIVILYLASVAILLIIFLIFRFLTRHFLQMQAYIKALSKGEFSAAIKTHPKEEMGQIALALQTMGKSIEHIVNQLESLDQGIADASEKLDKTAKEQTQAVALQETFLFTLDQNIRKIATNSRELADTMGSFSQMSEDRLKKDRGQKGLNLLQLKMNLLMNASSNILEDLAIVHQKEMNTRSLTSLMTKISDQASLLALNAGIEALNVGERSQLFRDTTEKIHNFSEKTWASTHAIKKIVSEMAQSISIGTTTAQSCIKEITVGANRLIEVSNHLKTIATQDEMQNEKFQIVNNMMQDQAAVSGNVIASVTSLNNISNENNISVRQLYQAILELGITTQELRGVVRTIFSEKEE